MRRILKKSNLEEGASASSFVPLTPKKKKDSTSGEVLEARNHFELHMQYLLLLKVSQFWSDDVSWITPCNPLDRLDQGIRLL